MSSKRTFHVVPPSGSSTPLKRRARVLIADDDRDTANMLAVVLQAEGHEVVTALRGDDALNMSRLFRPEVVIADINMPGTSGYAIARELRERHGNLAPLLIGISGVWTGASDRLLGELAGFDHYLVKPADPNAVLDLIARFQAGTAQEDASSA